MRCRERQVSYAEATGSRSEGPRLQFYVAGKAVPLSTTIFKVGPPSFLFGCPMFYSREFDASSDPCQCSQCGLSQGCLRDTWPALSWRLL